MNIGLLVDILCMTLKYAHIDRYFSPLHIKDLPLPFKCLPPLYSTNVSHSALSHNLNSFTFIYEERRFCQNDIASQCQEMKYCI